MKNEIDYVNIAKEIGELVTEKQKAYGDSFNRSCEIVKILYPEGVKPEQYKDLLTIVRIIDKLFRIATDKDAFGESPYRDIAGYGLLGTSHSNKKKEVLFTPISDSGSPGLSSEFIKQYSLEEK